MSDTMPTTALLGFSGERGVDVRAYPGVRLRAHNAATLALLVGSDEPVIERFATQQFGLHHGTTLGIHSSGGPQS